MKTMTLMILIFLTACAAERGSYFLYDVNSYKGEPGLISSSQALIITVVDNSPTFSLIKKYNNKSRSLSRLNDYYLPPGEHKITARGNSGYGMTIYGDFTFKVLIEAGHKYVIDCEDKNISHAVVFIEDLTTGKKVGTLQ